MKTNKNLLPRGSPKNLLLRGSPIDPIFTHFCYCSCSLQLLPIENVLLIPRVSPVDSIPNTSLFVPVHYNSVAIEN